MNTERAESIGKIIWAAPDGNEHECSQEFLTWEEAFVKTGRIPGLSEQEMGLYFAWLFCGDFQNLYSADHRQKIFSFDGVEDISAKKARIIQLWRNLRSFTNRYDMAIFRGLKKIHDDLMGADPDFPAKGAYIDIACAVLQPTGVRIFEGKNPLYPGGKIMRLELYHSENDDIIAPVLFNKMALASRQGSQRFRDQGERRFRAKWGEGETSRIYCGALLSVLKNGRFAEEYYDLYLDCISDGEKDEMKMVSNLGYSKNRMWDWPSQLTSWCKKIEETVDRVIAGDISYFEPRSINLRADGDQLIRSIVLKFCMENYPCYFSR